MDLVSLWQLYAEQDNSNMIELFNYKNEPVGAVILSKVEFKEISITETKTADKYMLSVGGTYIFFSYYKKEKAKQIKAQL